MKNLVSHGHQSTGRSQTDRFSHGFVSVSKTHDFERLQVCATRLRTGVFPAGWMQIRMSLFVSQAISKLVSMSKTSRSDAARKAWKTRRRSAPREKLDRSTPEGRILFHAQRAAAGAIGRASKAGIPVDVEWMHSAPAQIRAQGYCCALTGIRFDVDYRTEGAGGTHLAPSPDRVDPGAGYIEGNVRWVLWAVNRAKGEMPDDLFLRICRAVSNSRDK